MLVTISLTENVAQTATLAPGLGPPMTLSNGALQTPRADVSRLAVPTTQEATMVLTMARTAAATLLILMIPLICIPGVTRASPIRTMIARK